MTAIAPLDHFAVACLRAASQIQVPSTVRQPESGASDTIHTPRIAAHPWAKADRHGKPIRIVPRTRDQTVVFMGTPHGKGRLASGEPDSWAAIQIPHTNSGRFYRG